MPKSTFLVSIICVLFPISIIIATIIGIKITKMKKSHFVLSLLVCISSAAVAFIIIWGIIHGNLHESSSLGTQMFGSLFGPIFDVGIWVILFIVNGIWAIKDFKGLKMK